MSRNIGWDRVRECANGFDTTFIVPEDTERRVEHLVGFPDRNRECEPVASRGDSLGGNSVVLEPCAHSLHRPFRRLDEGLSLHADVMSIQRGNTI